MAKKKRKKAAKVFIDSSVLIAAAISPTGSAREILEKGFNKKLILYISNDVLEETERNLELKSSKSLDYFYKFSESLVVTVINPTKNQIRKVIKSIEAKDAPIVAGAISAKADYLVTYDRKHLF